MKVEDIQKKILEIFIEFKKICKKYNLRYYAIGGTCIGAIRHKGFIPWDDDMDVAMPLDDYIEFRKVAPTELKEPFELLDYLNKSQEHKLVSFMKLQNKNTTFIESVEKNYPSRYKGIFIDIMPIIGISKNRIANRMFQNRLQLYFYLNKIRNTNYSERTTRKGKIIWKIFHVFVKNKNKEYYYEKMEKLYKKYTFSENNDVFFAWRIPLTKPYSNTFNYKWFQSTIELPFENTTICVPSGYEEYLTKDFGNYMKLPPKEKQVSNHRNTIIDLNKPFREYTIKDDE